MESSINKSFIDKRISLVLKGIAIIMMVAGHALGHPDYWITPLASPIITNIAPFLRMLSRMSVGIFTFLAGYSCCRAGLNDKRLIPRIRALKKLLIHYWFLTFIVFLPIALLLGDYTISLKGMLYNLTGLKDPLILFAWYVPFFVTVIIGLVPLMNLILRGGMIQDLIVAVGVGSLIRGLLYLVRGYSDYLYIMCDWSGYYTVYMIGYLTAKHSLYERLQDFCEKRASALTRKSHFRLLMYGSVLLIVLVLRYFVQGIKILSFESFYVFVFIYCLVLIIPEYRHNKTNSKRTDIMGKLGMLSTDIWFIHALFFSNATRALFQKLISWIPGGLLKTICILVLSSVLAILTNYIINTLFFRKGGKYNGA